MKVIRKKPGRGTAPASLSKMALEKNDPLAQRPTLWAFTLQVLYKNLYILGITLLRRKLRYTRDFLRFMARVKGGFYAVLERIGGFLLSCWKGIARRLKAPFQRINRVREEQAPLIRAAREKGKVPASSYMQITGAVLKLISTILVTIFNHLAPLAAAWLLVYTVSSYLSVPLGLAVEYNDEVIGYVSNEADFEAAAQTLRSRFIGSGNTTVVQIPRFRLVGVTPQDDEAYTPLSALARRLVQLDIVDEGYTKEDVLADEMVQASGNEIELAYGLYVSNVFYGAVTDGDYLINELESIKEDNKVGLPDERVDFIKPIAVRQGLYPLNSVVREDDIERLLYSYETQEQVYVAEAGDTPTGVADKTGVPYDLLVEMNPWIEENVYEGDEIRTQVAQPFLSVQNIYTEVYREELPYERVDIETETYAIGYEQVAQEGVPGVQELTAEVTAVNGVETARTVQSTRVVRPAVEEKVIVGTNDPTQIQSAAPPAPGTDMTGSGATSSTGFIWPTDGGSINGGIGSYPGHTGVDIPRPSGTPIYASAAGTVVLSKQTYQGYGHYVIVDHGNGYQTLYAHASQLYVSVGDSVSQGQVIAAVGRTGRATGNHLHFEVRYQGRIMIPQNYIGYR